jgi:acyl carrier protein
MTDAEIRTVVLRAIRNVAPEVPSEQVKPDVDLREQLDIDSMDFVNLLARLEEELSVRIGETDSARLVTVNALVTRLSALLARGPTGAAPR